MTLREMFEAANKLHRTSDLDVIRGRITSAMLDRKPSGFYLVDEGSGFVVAGPIRDQMEALTKGETLRQRSGRDILIRQVLDVPT